MLSNVVMYPLGYSTILEPTKLREKKVILSCIYGSPAF